MPYRPELHHRRSIRLPGHDYASPGYYHVTLRVLPGMELSAIVDGQVILNPYGRIADETWADMAASLDWLRIDARVIMPDHLHVLLDVSASSTPRKPLGGIVGMFKTRASKAINLLAGTPGQGRWKRNYYEQCLIHPEAIHQIRQYILNNPKAWSRKD